MLNISPHTHPESLLTGSTVAAMIGQAKKMGRTHFAYTDLGHLSSCLKAYGLCKPDKKKIEELAKTGQEHLKKELKFAAGIEFYFKDNNDLIVGSKADKCKYFTATIFAKNQTAYQEIVKIASKTDLPKIEISDETQSLWGWAEIEHLAKFDTVMVLGGIHCIVGKTFLADGAFLAEKVLLKLRQLFQKRLSLSLICEPWDKKYASVIKISYKDKTHDSLLASDTVTTNKVRKIKIGDLITRSGHNFIKSKVVGNTYFEVNKEIIDITVHKGFLPLPCDVTFEINKFFIEMGKKHHIDVLVSDYAFYANKEDHIVQTMVLENKTKLKSKLYMKSERDFLEYLILTLKVPKDEALSYIKNNNDWAQNFNDFNLKYEYRLADSGGNPLRKCLEIIKANGRMKWDDPTYIARLKEEVDVIAKNGTKDFSAYFLPIHDVIKHYRDNQQLTGPSRGSAGGSLFCYLMGITQVDPIRYGLSFPRFLSLDRIKNGDIPDVDTDFPDRELLVGKDGKSGYLYGRWGNKAAQISTRHKVRLKSAVKDTNRYLKGSVERDIEVFSKALPEPPQGVPDLDLVFGYEDTDGNHVDGLLETYTPLKEYIARKPDEWEIVQKALGITRAHSMHASAFAISDIPIQDILPTKEGHITQYEAKQVEACGILKYDFLTVSNIKDIQDCLKLVNKKNKENQNIGYFTHKGKLEYIWDLPNDPDAFRSCWDGNVTTLFQIDTKTMAPAVQEICPETVEDNSVIIALKRPGPMDYRLESTGRTMDNEYIARRQGKSEPDLKELYDLIPETYGVIVFQEQSLKISKELGDMTPGNAEKLRRLFSKKQKKEANEMKPIFMSTAIPKIGEENANKIWDMMETSSRYSFNLSHSLGYSLITYAGLFLRHNYPLEWWASIMSNAEQEEISGKLWPHIKHLMASPDINLSSDKMEIDYANHKIRAKLGVIKGMAAATINPIIEAKPYKDIQDFVDKEVAGPGLAGKLTHVGVLDSLFPPKSTFMEKMQLLEDAQEIKKFNNKVKKAREEGKEIKITEAKKGEIPDLYKNLAEDGFKNAAIKKSILPSLLVGLYDIGRYKSKFRDLRGIEANTPTRRLISPIKSVDSYLFPGDYLKRQNETDGTDIEEGYDNQDFDQFNQYEDNILCVMAYILDFEVFDYKKNTKQALKLLMDCDGYVKEHVLWPDYHSGLLDYPKELKKGQICAVFLKKRVGRDGDCTILEIAIEC